MNSELLETFLKIVEYKQISQAAEALYITQAAVSNRLNRLESELGVTLIHRVKGQSTVSLTAYGKKLIPLAQQLVQLTKETSNLKELANYQLVSVMIQPDINHTILSQILPLLLEEDPLLRYSIKTSSSRNIYDSVANGTTDVGFTFIQSSRYQTDIRKIGEDPLVLIASAKSSYPVTVSAEMLSEHDEILIPYNRSYKEWHLMCWNSELEPFIRLDSSSDVNNYLINNNTWAIIPESMLNKLLREHADIRKLHLTEQPPTLPIFAVKHKKANQHTSEIDRLILKVRSEFFKMQN
ncbi:LysR family transcriptional regulator [Secundilactobacillus yichangensis]|uniref:LysR family transcriptional regulator n=1 Tax=Secundilactobacillus yichangensis TaxID=2799580 RepID=UPI001942F585|nr:LysR family transcriptional regulator [Secundilactobacillus yichangensis]